ncbi:MAG: ribonuclease II [Micrococcales bacterium 70-64]|nr:RNB domain-containing ribonuclease [Leifsonia sp.]ODU65456.1 MAG: ribonuclease II [Leifsonia sp. SCN 70-46]OJX87202.1 MAG: ribonuclease II [Micrococcales bacterium 70-64]
MVPRVSNPTELLAATLRQIREDLNLPESFPPAVEAEAEEAVEGVELPDADQTDIPFVTIDPEGATDLDQALHLERAGQGYRVRYAIADVPAFVAPGGEVDTEARERGQTLYAPDGRIPLHPTAISEHAASLLEGQVRGAFVWTFELDADGDVTSTALERARVRSRHQLSYAEVQGQLDGGTASESLRLLREVGMKRADLERRRGGASLNRPDEEVEFRGGRYELVRRSPLPVEEWNAQMSLMTGMAAAKAMLDGGVGILRTMPAPFDDTLEHFRTQVGALGCPWPREQPYGEYLRGLDRDTAAGLAAIHAAASLFRGAGYTAFDGELPESTTQAAVAAPYAHATAPLRRLVDRFVLVTCEALLNGRPVPGWVREALPALPKIMGRSDGVASRLEHASVDAIEAALLSARVGETFDAVVISAKESGGVIQLTDPVVTAAIEGAVTAGESVRAILVTADIATGTTLFRVAGA